jgi:hypothetical protein
MFGRIVAGLDDVNAWRGGQATTRTLAGANLPARVKNEQADFAAGASPLQQILDGVYQDLAGAQGGVGGYFTSSQTRLVNLLKAMWSVDQGFSSNAPLAVLTAVDQATALKTLISQMQGAAASVNASVPGAGTQTAGPQANGNPVVVLSFKNGQGLTLQYVFPEVLSVTCSGDSQAGGATLGNEPLSVKGQPAVSDVFSQLWPGGSGVNLTLGAVDGSKSSSTGNVLQNSDFAVASTPNIPDNWTLQVGVAGTDVFVSAGNAYTPGGGSLQLTGTGAALLDAVTQAFNTAPSVAVGVGGTSYALKPDTVYHVNGWVKCSATPTAGVLELALTDGSAYPGAVMNDDAGTANLFTKSLTAVSTTYVSFNGVFRTPAVLPAATPYRLRVRLSTAIDSGKSAFLARLSACEAKQLYPGGPFASVHSGNAKLIAGDSWNLAVTNTFGAVQKWMERVFGMRNLGLQIPSSATPTVADTVVA